MSRIADANSQTPIGPEQLQRMIDRQRRDEKCRDGAAPHKLVSIPGEHPLVGRCVECGRIAHAPPRTFRP